MKLDESTLSEIMESVKPSLIEGLQNELKSNITWETKEEISKQIREYVETWAKKEIIPEIARMLTEDKDSLVSLGVKLGQEVVEAMVKEMSTAIKSNLENAWKRKKIFEALLD